VDRYTIPYHSYILPIPFPLFQTILIFKFLFLFNMDYAKKRKQNENEESNSVTSPWSKRKANGKPLGGEETNPIVVMSDRYTIYLFFKNLFIFVYFDRLNCLINRLNCLIKFLYLFFLIYSNQTAGAKTNKAENDRNPTLFHQSFDNHVPLRCSCPYEVVIFSTFFFVS
jgi:hypothetical protein